MKQYRCKFWWIFKVRQIWQRPETKKVNRLNEKQNSMFLDIVFVSLKLQSCKILILVISKHTSSLQIKIESEITKPLIQSTETKQWCYLKLLRLSKNVAKSVSDPPKKALLLNNLTLKSPNNIELLMQVEVVKWGKFDRDLKHRESRLSGKQTSMFLT